MANHPQYSPTFTGGATVIPRYWDDRSCFANLLAPHSIVEASFFEQFVVASGLGDTATL
jgi:hypothetical protein